MSPKFTSKKPKASSSSSSSSSSSDDEPVVKNSKGKVSFNPLAAKVKAVETPKVVEKPAPKVVSPQKTATPLKSVPDKVPDKKFPKRKASSSSSSSSSDDDEPAPKKTPPAPQSQNPRSSQPQTPRVENNEARAVETHSPKKDTKKAQPTPKVQAPRVENNKAPVPEIQTPRKQIQCASEVETPRTETKKVVSSMFDSTCPHCGHGLEVKFKIS